MLLLLYLGMVQCEPVIICTLRKFSMHKMKLRLVLQFYGDILFSYFPYRLERRAMKIHLNLVLSAVSLCYVRPVKIFIQLIRTNPIVENYQ